LQEYKFSLCSDWKW